MSGRQTVCLNMIVKNEAHVIERCLASVRPFIDSYLIVDTGSSDGTQDVIRRVFADLPGEVVDRPWRGFGASRTEAIELARNRADYLLFIDADDVLEVPPGYRRPLLTADVYEMVIVHGQLSHRRYSLVSTRLDWRYVGVLHEYLECGTSHTRALLHDVRMRIVGGGGRSQVSLEEKYARDAELLEAALVQEPDNTRYAFYLAQSYRDSGQLEKALAAYERRATMAGFDQEIYISLLAAGRIAARLGRPVAEVVHRYLLAWERRPTRAEAIGELLTFLREREPRWNFAHLIGRAAHEIPLSDDVLFVEPYWYLWRCTDEYAIAAYWAGDFETCRALCENLLRNPALPPEQAPRVRANLDFALQKLGRPA